MNLHAFPRTALATLLMGALLSSISAAQSTESTSAAAPYPPDAPAYSHASLDLRQPSPKPETWLFPITRLNASLPTWLQFGGQFRNRAEGQLGLRYAPVDDGHDLTQLRLGVYVQPSSWFKLVGVTQDSRVFFNHRVPNASPYQNVWDVREAYVQFGNSESGWINVSAGREILSFGDERVIGPSDWVNMGRTFDVARVDLHSAAWQITLFASSVIIPRDGVVDHHNQGNNLHGVYSRFTKLIPHATLEPYLFWRLTPASLRLSENAGLGHMSEVTGGARFAGYLRAIDYDVEMNKQTGSLGNKSIDAWAGHWNAGYTLKDLRFKPRPFVEYNYASGNKNPNSRTWSTHSGSPCRSRRKAWSQMDGHPSGR